MVKRQETRHPELASEQSRLDDTYELAERTVVKMRGGPTVGAHQAAALAVRDDRLERIGELEEAVRSSEPFYFGRLDFEEGASDGDLDDGESTYIGRVGLFNELSEAVVVSWKSPAAEPYYRATRSTNFGVARRRTLTGKDRLLTDLADDVLGVLPAHLFHTDDWATPQDLLLAELQRSRDGEMRDIVATIQAEQDELIRADMGQTLVVQGGPGTGKTAVGLHRASFLLFHHSQTLRPEDALVIAPNPVFLEYISRVLPSLGDSHVRHLTVDSLGPSVRTTRRDPDHVVAVKGDARMAKVLANYLFGRIRHIDSQVELLDGRLKVKPDLVNATIDRIRGSARTYNGGRDALREALVEELSTGRIRRQRNLASQIRRDRAFERLLMRAWPTLSAHQIVADLLTGARRLKSATEHLLTSEERDAIAQPSISRLEEMVWSVADVPLIDEASWLLDGPPRNYRHLIVDEAQDLSPMQLRMLGRRSASGSMTILGDLAQATSPWAPKSWKEVMGHLSIRKWNVAELTTGYRVPKEIMQDANPLIEIMGLDVPHTESIRSTGVPIQYERLDREDLIPALTDRAREAMRLKLSTGVVIPDDLYEEIRDAFLSAKVKFGEAERGDLSHRVTLVPNLLTKGLEFDNVLMVDGVVESRGPGADARLRYVAMTRAMRELTIIDVPRPNENKPATAPLSKENRLMTDISGVSYQVPAIRFQQDGQTLYITALESHVLGELGVVDEWDPALDEDDPEQGYQRRVMESHAKKIARFLLDPEHGRLMPTAAVLNARQRLEFVPVAENGQEQIVGTLHLTWPLFIVDGQHRNAGFKLASVDEEEIAAFPQPVVIMEDVEKLEEIRQFQTINTTAKRVRTDLADRLLKTLGEFEDPSKTWKAKALEIADHLNATPNGPWKSRITMPNTSGGVATQRTMTDSLKIVLNGVARTWDVNTTAAALNNFWEALRRLMPEAFEEPKRFVLQKSVGTFAWHEVAADVFLRCYANGRDLGLERMLELLKETGDYVDPEFWLSKSNGGIAPNYGGRAGFSALAQEIIAELPAMEIFNDEISV